MAPVQRFDFGLFFVIITEVCGLIDLLGLICFVATLEALPWTGRRICHCRNIVFFVILPIAPSECEQGSGEGERHVGSLR